MPCCWPGVWSRGSALPCSSWSLPTPARASPWLLQQLHAVAKLHSRLWVRMHPPPPNEKLLLRLNFHHSYSIKFQTYQRSAPPLNLS
jgi:hypothetical protein